MEVFNYTDYKQFLRDWLELQPKKGRGIALQLAKKLNVSSVLISQILKGTRSLQMDYAYAIAEFLSLDSNEMEYFLTLVQTSNSGNPRYREFMSKRLEALRARVKDVKHRVAKDIELPEAVKAEFYSHWHYSAVRLLTDIPETQTPAAISERLRIPVGKTKQILQFLVAHGLCTNHSGIYKMGAKMTHLGSDSPWVYSRQLHWRQMAMQKMEKENAENLFYTGPMVLSEKDGSWIRERLVTTIKQVTERARLSPSEKLVCLNIDWFGV